MGEFFVIGLPRTIRQRVEATVVRHGGRVRSILAQRTPERVFQLLPHPKQAVHVLRAYLDECESVTDPIILVMPYAPIPQELSDELDAVRELGGDVRRPAIGTEGWPAFKRRRDGDSDNDFEKALFGRLAEEMGATQPLAPSAHLQQLCQNHAGLLVPDNVLDECDNVAPHRRDFIRNSADALVALVALVRSGGGVGGLAEFFLGRGLHLAQSGGITTTIRVYKAGELVHEEASNWHLKQGDATTPQAAARVYFQAFSVDGEYYVAVMYAGPHPDGSGISRSFVIEQG